METREAIFMLPQTIAIFVQPAEAQRDRERGNKNATDTARNALTTDRNLKPALMPTSPFRDDQT